MYAHALTGWNRFLTMFPFLCPQHDIHAVGYVQIKVSGGGQIGCFKHTFYFK